MQCHATLWHTLAYSGILLHALAYSGIINASLITADGAYHCPVGSIWLFFPPMGKALEVQQHIFEFYARDFQISLEVVIFQD